MARTPAKTTSRSKKAALSKATKAASTKRAAERASLPALVTQTQLAKILGLTSRRIGMLIKDGVFTPVGKSKLNLADSVQAYVEFRERFVESKVKGPTSADKLREMRQLELSRKIAREDRQIITLDEAMGTVDAITGIYLTSLSGLPARITRDLAERKRLEKIFDEQRQRLTKRFSKEAHALETGEQPDQADGEDDAG